MSNLIKVIGCVVFTAWMFCPPVLLTCAFCLNWSSFLRWSLTIVALVQFGLVTNIVYQEVEEE